MTGATTARNKVFISYSRDDAAYVPVVRKHLRPLERRHGLDIWDDSEIEAGADWMNEIVGAIGSTRAVVLLVSASFLASDFIHTQELPRLLEQADEHGAVVLAVHVGHSLFTETSGLSHLQSVNNPAAPLSDLPKGEQEKVFVKLAATVLRLFPQPPPATETTTPANQQTADALKQLPRVSSALEELRQQLRDKLGDDDTLYEPAALVAESIMLDGLRAVARRAHPGQLARSLAQSLEAAREHVRAAARPLETDEQRSQVIRYAAADPDIALLVEHALHKRAGLPVRVEAGRQTADEWEQVRGMRLPYGFLSPDFIPTAGPREVVLEDVFIHCNSDTVSDEEALAAPIRNLFHQNQTGTTPRRSLLVIAGGLKGGALRAVLDERAAGRNITAARHPGDDGLWGRMFFDFFFVTVSHVDMAIVNEDETYLIAGPLNPAWLKVRLDSIRKQLGEATDAHQRDELTKRLNNLEGGVWIIRVGGKTDEERRRRAERVRRVVRHYEKAAASGVVAGEHLALANAAAALREQNRCEEERAADAILADALEAPLRRMAEGWARDGEETLRAVRLKQKAADNPGVGYYGEEDAVIDLFEAGAVVPAENVITLMREAVEVAAERIAALRFTDGVVQEVAALEGR